MRIEKTWKRVLSMIMAFAIVVSFMPPVAVNAAEDKTIYLNAGGSNLWDQADAWFDAWVWGSAQGDKWYTFSAKDENGLYSISVPSDMTGMKIYRRGPGHTGQDFDENQWNNTGDVVIPNDKNLITITGWENGNYSWSTYVAPDPLDSGWVILGSFNEWNTTQYQFMRAEAGATTASVSVELAAGTTYQFKLMNNGNWYGYDQFESDEHISQAAVDGNAQMTTTIAGIYVFTMDLSNQKLSVTYPTPAAPNAELSGTEGTNGWYKSAMLTAPSGYEIAASESDEWGNTLSIPEGNYETTPFTYALKDGDGNVVTKTVTVKVDGTVPAISEPQIVMDAANNKATVTVAATDATSGVASYALTGEGVDVSEFNEANSSFTVTDMDWNKEYTMILTVMDAAGNTATKEFTLVCVCDHSGNTAQPTDNSNGKHSFTCSVCHDTVTEPHTFHSSTGQCACGVQAQASVTPNGGEAVYYTVFSEALSAWLRADDQTLTLWANVTADSTIQVAKAGMVLDLNGKTLTGNVTVGDYDRGAINGMLTVQDSGSDGKISGKLTVSYGSAEMTGGWIDNSNKGNGVYVGRGADFTISGGKVTGWDAITNIGTVRISGNVTLEGKDYNQDNPGYGLYNGGTAIVSGNPTIQGETIDICADAPITFQYVPTTTLRVKMNQAGLFAVAEGVTLTEDMFISKKDGLLVAQMEGGIGLVECDHQGGEVDCQYLNKYRHRNTYNCCDLTEDVEHTMENGVCTACGGRYIYFDVKNDYSLAYLHYSESDKETMTKLTDDYIWQVVASPDAGTVYFSLSDYYFLDETVSTEIPADKNCFRMTDYDYQTGKYNGVWYSYPCTSHTFADDGHCAGCGAACDHASVTEDGKCEICGLLHTVKVTAGEVTSYCVDFDETVTYIRNLAGSDTVYITLLNSMSENIVTTIPARTVVLDLNGKTLNIEHLVYASDADVTLKGSTGSKLIVGGHYVDDGAKLTLESGAILSTDDYQPAVYVYGTFVMTGGEVSATGSNADAINVQGESAVVQIKGGTVSSASGYALVNMNNSPNIELSGGTFIGGIRSYSDGYDEENIYFKDIVAAGCKLVDADGNDVSMNSTEVSGTVSVVCDHSKSDHETATDLGDGKHSFTCTVCHGTGTENCSGGTQTCKGYRCEKCGGAYGEPNAANHDSTVAFDADGFCPNGCYEPAVDFDNDGYYEIGNAGQLYWFAQQVNDGRTAINAILTDDITVNAETMSAETTGARPWILIGNVGRGYLGVFDGRDHTISGLYFNDPDTTESIGLFGAIYQGGIVKNVKVTNSYFNGNQDAGGIAGRNYSDVINCSFSGSVYAKGNAGGIVGSIPQDNSAQKGSIRFCHNFGSVGGSTVGNSAVGGIVGKSVGGSITGCYNTVDLCDGLNNFKVGGIVGVASATTIIECYNTGNMGGYYGAGGIAGECSGCTVTDCYNTGSANASEYDAGLAAVAENSSFTNCYFNNEYVSVTGYPLSAIGSNSDCSEDLVEGKTAAQFASGEVAYLLNGSVSGGETWKQNLGTDTYPTFTGEKIYYGYTSCAENAVKIYTNDSTSSATKPVHNPIYSGSGSTLTKRCSGCDKVMGIATISTEETTVVYNGSQWTVSIVSIGDLQNMSLSATFAGIDGTVYSSDVAPMDAGKYEARIIGAEIPDTAKASVSFEITKRPITITADSDSKVYDGTELNKDSYQITAGELAKDHTITVTVTGSQVNAGSGDNVPGNAVIKDKDGKDVTSNYDITYVNGTLTVNPIEVTVKIIGTDATVEYTGTEQSALGYEIVIPDGSYFKKESVTCSGEAIAKGIDADTYPMGLTAARFSNTDANYAVTFVVSDGKLVITPKGITEADVRFDGELIYTGSALTQKIKVTEGITYTVTGNKATDVGTYTLTVDASGNYSGTVTKEWTIQKADATVETAPAAKELTYTGKDQVLVTAGATTDGKLVYSLSENGRYSDTIPTGKTAGNYIVWYYVVGDENHNDSEKATVAVTINKAKLTVTAGDNTITYGDAPEANGVTYSGFVSSETESVLGGELTYSYNYEQFGNVGTYKITPVGLTSANYEIEFIDGTLTINKRAIVVAAKDQTVTHGEAISAAGYTVTGLAEGHSVVVTITPSTAKVTADGEIEITAVKVLADGEDVTGNYSTATSMPAKLVIEPDTSKIDGLTTENVTSADKEKLEAVLDMLENSDSLTEEWETLVEEIRAMLEILENVEEVEETISKLPETVVPDDGELVLKILNAKASYDALTDYEKSLVDEGAVKKLSDLVAALTAYDIIKGNGGKWTQGSDEGLSFTANGLFSKFIGIQVDGEDVAEEHYEAKSGSTIIILKMAYLETLTIGEHTLTVLYTDGETEGAFHIEAEPDETKPEDTEPEETKPEASSPATGDDFNIMLCGSVFTVSLAALAALLLADKKRKQVN